MSRDEKLDSIISMLASDANLLATLRRLVVTGLQAQDDAAIEALYTALTEGEAP